MNREIKFRCFDTVTKKYFWPWPEGFNLFGEVTCFDAMGQQLSDQGRDRILGLNDLVIEQFTGIKDRNGTELYEGDLVKMDDDWMPIGAIQFQKTGAIGWCVEGELGNGYKRRSLLDSVAYEIIGNLNENSELLK